MFNVYKHFFLILYPCVKAWNCLICDSFCCVSNFTYKFIMARKKKKLLGLTHHESQPEVILLCISLTMFSLQLCDLKWQQQSTKIEGAGGFSWFSVPNGLFRPFGHLSRANRRGKEQTQQLPRRGRGCRPAFHALGSREGKIIRGQVSETA